MLIRVIWPLSGLKGEDRVGLRAHALALLLLDGRHRCSGEFLFADVRVGEALKANDVLSHSGGFEKVLLLLLLLLLRNETLIVGDAHVLHLISLLIVQADGGW